MDSTPIDQILGLLHSLSRDIDLFNQHTAFSGIKFLTMNEGFRVEI